MLAIGCSIGCSSTPEFVGKWTYTDASAMTACGSNPVATQPLVGTITFTSAGTDLVIPDAASQLAITGATSGTCQPQLKATDDQADVVADADCNLTGATGDAIAVDYESFDLMVVDIGGPSGIDFAITATLTSTAASCTVNANGTLLAD